MSETFQVKCPECNVPMKREPTPMPGWLARQLDAAERTVDAWPEGKKHAAGLPSTWPEKSKQELLAERYAYLQRLYIRTAKNKWEWSGTTEELLEFQALNHSITLKIKEG